MCICIVTGPLLKQNVNASLCDEKSNLLLETDTVLRTSELVSQYCRMPLTCKQRLLHMQKAAIMLIHTQTHTHTKVFLIHWPVLVI